MDEINKTLSLANTDLNDLKTGISNYDKLIKDMGSVEDQIQEDEKPVRLHIVDDPLEWPALLHLSLNS